DRTLEVVDVEEVAERATEDVVRRDGGLGVHAEVVDERGQAGSLDEQGVVPVQRDEPVARSHREHGDPVAVGRRGWSEQSGVRTRRETRDGNRAREPNDPSAPAGMRNASSGRWAAMM